MTFNAKNLHYEKQEPAFLRRLRTENSSDRHNVSIARPRKPRLETGDDDGPTIVDEQGENVTEQEYQDLLLGKTENVLVARDTSTVTKPDSDLDAERLASDSAAGGAQEREKPSAAGSNVLRKRKQGKAVAAEPEPEPQPEPDPQGLEIASGLPETKKADESKARLKSKKKKIKLSFDDLGT